MICKNCGMEDEDRIEIENIMKKEVREKLKLRRKKLLKQNTKRKRIEIINKISQLVRIL